MEHLFAPPDPILIAKAIQDYYPQDCRFIPIHQGQLVYVFAMLKDRGNLFWAGSVSFRIVTLYKTLF